MKISKLRIFFAVFFIVTMIGALLLYWETDSNFSNVSHSDNLKNTFDVDGEQLQNIHAESNHSQQQSAKNDLGHTKDEHLTGKAIRIELLMIVDSRMNIPFKQRRLALDSLPREIDLEERGELVRFLRNNSSPESMSPQQIYVLKNDIMNYLVENHPGDPFLSEALVDMVNDENQDRVVRDYAVQHLAALYEHVPENDEIFSQLLFAAQPDTPEIAGSAVLGIADILSKDPNLPRESFEQLLADKLKSPATSENLKATLIQVGLRQNQALIDDDLVGVFQETDNYVLKLSTLAAMGKVKSPYYLNFLKEIAAGEDAYLGRAARQALNNESI